MTDQPGGNSRNSTTNNSRILGGHGTHNRPWIIEDSADGSTSARPNADASSQQQIRQNLLLKRNKSLSSSEHDNSRRTNHTESDIQSSLSIRRAVISSQPIESAKDTNQRRSSTSDIRSVASADSGSSYDRYLAQKRAAKEQQQQQQKLASSNSQEQQIRQSVAQRHNTKHNQAKVSGSTSIHPPGPDSPVLEKHYTSSGKAVLLAPSKADNGSHPRRRLIGNIPLDIQPSTRDDSILMHDSNSSSTRATYQSTFPASVNTETTATTSNNTRRSTWNAEEGPSTNSTSRDLRARRLIAAQQSRSVPTNTTSSTHAGPTSSSTVTAATRSTNVTTTPITATVPLHFHAHDAAVEKYLTRSRLNADPGRSRTTSRQSDVSSSSNPVAHSTQKSSTQHSSIKLSSNDKRINKAATEYTSHQINTSDVPGKVNTIQLPRANTEKNRSTETLHIDKVKAYNNQSELAKELQQPSINNMGWSTMKRASSTGYHNVTTEAIAAHDAYKAETARTMANVLPLGSGSHKVDEYLAQRNALKAKVSSYTRSGTNRVPNENVEVNVANSSHVMVTAPLTAVSCDESTENDRGEEMTDTESDDDTEHDIEDDEYYVNTDQSEASMQWGIKVCIISAVDFPASVVPNLPFSPMIKFGLIKLETKTSNDVPAMIDQTCTNLAKTIERDGLCSIPNSRIRCTSAKILSKRDNGSVEFHEEIRWDNVNDPQHIALALELSSRAVLPPANYRESPPQQKVGPFVISPSSQSTMVRPTVPQKSTLSKEAATSVIGSMFRNIRKADSAEMEEANAAAAVAKHLIQGDVSQSTNAQNNNGQHSKGLRDSRSEIDVKLRPRTRKRRKMSEELRIGAKVIPLSVLPLNNAMNRHETVRIEQWVELNTCTNTVKTSLVGTSPSSSTATRNPSILLEISFSSRDNLDESEDELDEMETKAELKASYSKRVAIKIRKQLKQDAKPQVEKAVEPMLEPGIIDYVCVVGARDIGDQKDDDGSSGWVNSSPECCILEQFPPDDEFHAKRGRAAVLAGKIEWFCFPEGCKLWRGLTPPNHDELNLKRFSASSSGNISAAIASFDACLGCTASFAWFVIASSSDKYGSESRKTYGAVIRFFVPAPHGIDSTQDDFAQTFISNASLDYEKQNDVKRLWVPMGICITSSLPIVGIMEVMLLRLCQSLSNTGVVSKNFSEDAKSIREAIVCAIVSFQKPIPGVVNCSFPFLQGERLHIALPARTGLPPLPHGSSVSAVCRLLGADGLNFLLAAFLTECKILLHSDEVANLSMVAEVVTALIYPFEWALPYVPVLPAEMMEFVEAPVSFLIGVPSCNMYHLDPRTLEDVVVVDLDRDFSTSDYFEGRRNGLKTKTPIPLPASVASNIAKATHRLIRADDELGATGLRLLPRLEPETLPEKEFRLSVALEVCGLIRGYDECLVFSSAQPVFNVDKFLQIAPSIFEEQRDNGRDHQGQNQGNSGSRHVISPRSRRFVSSLVCCQHFHQFLDVLEADTLTFFHVIMRSLQSSSTKKDKSLGGMLLSLEPNQTASDLCKMLLKVEDKTPTYRVKSLSGQWGTIFEYEEKGDRDHATLLFPMDLLQPIDIHSGSNQTDTGVDGVKSVSVEYLVELEKNPWRYQRLLDLIVDPTKELLFPAIEKVKLREAIGDRRYKAWKAGYDRLDGDDGTILSDDTMGLPNTLDLRNLLASVVDDFVRDEGENDEILAENSKNRAVIRRCLEHPRRGTTETEDLLEAAEVALYNPASKAFILSVLGKRIRKDEDERKKIESTPGRRRSLHYGGSKVDASLFTILVRLSFAMLDSCNETSDFESAYQLLKYTAGLYAALNESGNEINVVYVTERIGLHPIFGHLTLWENVKDKHMSIKMNGISVNETNSSDNIGDLDHEYEAVVATLYEMNGYGIPAKGLARFASRMCDCNGWFQSEKGQTILMLAKRVCLRRDNSTTSSNPSTMSDLDFISLSPRKRLENLPNHQSLRDNVRITLPDTDYKWIDIGWCHPAAQSSRRMDTNRRTGHNVVNKVEEEMNNFEGGKQNEIFMKRSAVTSMIYLGSSVVVTGGLDGGVFLARKVPSKTAYETKSTNTNTTVDSDFAIRGVHLDWGSSGSRYAVGSASATMDGEYGVGAVTCIAATQVSRSSISSKSSSSKDVVDTMIPDEEILEAMEGCRVVAGTTCGDLRVWSIKDVFTAVFYSNNRGSDESESGSTSITRNSGASSTKIQSKAQGSGTDFAAGSSLTRLKFSLRGRALSGHRGGVSCITVHSNVYRPDSIVSGGADGLIKLWNLRTPGTSGGRRSSVDPASAGNVGPSSTLNRVPIGSSSGVKGGTSGTSAGDALSILSGHGGRILCIKTAWHGDRLLSGGADRTVRLWDLASGNGGKCLNTLSGHFGWVTNVEYWGQNTFISASTDRSIGLWDVRVGNAPLFILRRHNAPISSLLIEPDNDAMLISAAIDGSVASWDFRRLATTENIGNGVLQTKQRECKVVRTPTVLFYSQQKSRHNRSSIGPVYLTKGIHPNRKTVQCLGGDAIVREWDYRSGEVVNEYWSGHCDTVSNFVGLAGDKVLGTQLESVGSDKATATISASWDGTVRMRTLVSTN